MQLLEDRRQSIANDNVKLMERMSRIMTTSRQPTSVGKMTGGGKNEAFRKREEERVASENIRMTERLNSILPVLSSAQLEKDYTLHQKDVRSLRKRIPQRSRILPDTDISRRASTESSVQSSTHSSSRSSTHFPSNIESNNLTSMSDFRKQFLGNRRSTADPLFLNRKNSEFPDKFMLFHNLSEK